MAERKLQELLKNVHYAREAIAKAKRGGRNMDIPERALRLAYAQVRAHCEEHALELPHDIPEAKAPERGGE